MRIRFIVSNRRAGCRWFLGEEHASVNLGAREARLEWRTFQFR